MNEQLPSPERRRPIVTVDHDSPPADLKPLCRLVLRLMLRERLKNQETGQEAAMAAKQGPRKKRKKQ